MQLVLEAVGGLVLIVVIVLGIRAMFKPYEKDENDDKPDA